MKVDIHVYNRIFKAFCFHGFKDFFPHENDTIVLFTIPYPFTLFNSTGCGLVAKAFYATRSVSIVCLNKNMAFSKQRYK